MGAITLKIRKSLILKTGPGAGHASRCASGDALRQAPLHGQGTIFRKSLILKTGAGAGHHPPPLYPRAMTHGKPRRRTLTNTTEAQGKPLGLSHLEVTKVD